MILKLFFLKTVNFEKKSADDNKSMKITQHANIEMLVPSVTVIQVTGTLKKVIGQSNMFYLPRMHFQCRKN